MHNIFFFPTQQISDDSNLFHQFKKQKIFYSYFQVDQNYYLFFYAQESIQIDFLYPFLEVIDELNYKQRRIRSFRGFFLYALGIIQNAQDYQILQTNLQPFFWKKVHNIIRQNKKDALLEFLFGSEVTRLGSENATGHGLDATIQTLQKSYDGLREQVHSLQQKVIQLETLLTNSKYPAKARRKLRLSDATQPLEPSKTTQQEVLYL